MAGDAAPHLLQPLLPIPAEPPRQGPSPHPGQLSCLLLGLARTDQPQRLEPDALPHLPRCPIPGIQLLRALLPVDRLHFPAHRLLLRPHPRPAGSGPLSRCCFFPPPLASSATGSVSTGTLPLSAERL